MTKLNKWYRRMGFIFIFKRNFEWVLLLHLHSVCLTHLFFGGGSTAGGREAHAAPRTAEHELCEDCRQD